MINKTNISNKELSELHNKLVQTVIDFFKVRDYPENIWILYFTMDDIKTSIKEGNWNPCSDSLLEIQDYNQNDLVMEM